MAGTRTPQRTPGRFSRAQRPPSSPGRRGVASGRSVGNRSATSGRRFGTSTTTSGRRFGRSAPQQSTLQRAMGAVGGVLPGSSKTSRSSSKMPGKPAGLALLAAAGVAIAKRDKLAGMLRRDDSSHDTTTSGRSTVTAGTATTSAPGTGTAPGTASGYPSAP
jgi:hypothetical protein